ncbi:MAG: aminopeptidase N [Deltaproteobacteria bacterium]|nr:aminopeptidase N [Deltaproteobacteria bacterium]
MSSEKPQAIFRHDYRGPDYWIDTVDLDFELGADATLVRARLALHRDPALAGDPSPLVLVGEELELLELRVDGDDVPKSRYHTTSDQLILEGLPERFELETLVRIHPEQNTTLSGLYRTSGNYCTQCEAMGFRRITYFLDRPDVMARFTTTITADRKTCPVLLSNGNRVLEEDLGDGRHRVRWEDPFPKPSYLFALVAGDLRSHQGTFTTCSGRQVALEIWVEPQNVDRCEHALKSLQKAMKWDEDVYGLEYDLDIYMIVAVNDFNMGAMENKGLNVFNSKYVLAQPESATDDDYEAIEGVIGHEYFHNWTGNRVTCRDWFQLTLKEGLTVFRDQQFSADMTSLAVKRIDDVKVLRTAQFAEDAGPMSHPIRPESYISMDNFYTATVYNKGAEVIRMIHTLLGAEGFQRGMDLYFERHDGKAVACDDFRAAMADAEDFDLEQFGLWYSQAGTPVVEVVDRWDEASGCYSLTLRQSYPDTGYDVPGSRGRRPLHIPVAMGLLAADGRDLPLQLVGESEPHAQSTRVLSLREAEQTWEFVGLDARPVPSLLRGFTAPVRVRMDRSREDLAFLMGRDSDPFNRWEAGQELATGLLVERAGRISGGEEDGPDALLSRAFGAILDDDSLDGSLKALALTLPGERVLAQEMEVVDPDALHAARERTRRELAADHREALLAAYDANVASGGYTNDKAAIDRRRLKNVALAYLVALQDDAAIGLAARQFEKADNMTDAQAALGLLLDTRAPARERALADFYARWHSDPLVLDKWFALQAASRRDDTLDRVLELAGHPDFSLRNPNRLRSLVGTFCAANPVGFHRADGAGYRFVADIVIEIDGMNPQLAARMVSAFNEWRRFDVARQQRMRAELERIAGQKSLSKDVYEIVGRALAN